MNFGAYLKSKKIDPVKFSKDDPNLFQELRSLFEQVHPNSFTQQKLFLINKLRRAYIFEDSLDHDTKKKPAQPKPKIIPKKPKI
jgi:hypothetical protein